MMKIGKILFALFLCSAVLVSCGGGTVPVPASETASAAETETAAPVTTEEETTAVDLPAARERISVRVMSFNIHGMNRKTSTMEYGNGGTTGIEEEVDATVATRGPKFRQLLRGEAIDIAGLQEWKSDVWGTWWEDHADSKYGLVVHYTHGTQEGGAVLYLKSRFTPVENGVFWLIEGTPTKWKSAATNQYSDSNWDRTCTWVLFQENATGNYFIFCDTHLDTNGSAAEKQAKVLSERIESLRGELKKKYELSYTLPEILVGDMNSTPSSNAYPLLISYLRDSRDVSQGTTVPSQISTSPWYSHCNTEADYVANGHRIDYILVSHAVKVTNYRMVHTSTNLCPYGAYLSDHNAVIADLYF